MTTSTWALVPREDAVRFILVGADHHSHRFVLPFTPSVIEWPAPVLYSYAEDIAVLAHAYALPSIGWRDVVYVADEDAARINVALRVAEAVILFVVGLRRMAEDAAAQSAMEKELWDRGVWDVGELRRLETVTVRLPVYPDKIEVATWFGDEPAKDGSK